jgi:hypothetical protein
VLVRIDDHAGASMPARDGLYPQGRNRVASGLCGSLHHGTTSTSSAKRNPSITVIAAGCAIDNRGAATLAKLLAA